MIRVQTGRREVLSLLAGTAAIGLIGCNAMGNELPTYRYRLTVEVDTPEGLRSGSSVIEVSTAVAGSNSIPTPGAVSHRVKGEAVTVDLGTRGLLFALLRSEDNSDWATNVIYRLSPKVPSVYDANGKFDNKRDFEAQFAAMLAYREPIELPRTFPPVAHLLNEHAWPMLVRFTNIDDPKSVERIDPDKIAEVYGEGVKIRRIVVQLTGNPITSGIDKRLRWLPHQRGSLIPIPREKFKDEMPIGSDLNEGDFSRSVVK